MSNHAIKKIYFLLKFYINSVTTKSPSIHFPKKSTMARKINSPKLNIIVKKLLITVFQLLTPQMPKILNMKAANVRYKMYSSGCVSFSAIYDSKENIENNKSSIKHTRDKMKDQKFNFLNNYITY